MRAEEPCLRTLQRERPEGSWAADQQRPALRPLYPWIAVGLAAVPNSSALCHELPKFSLVCSVGVCFLDHLVGKTALPAIVVGEPVTPSGPSGQPHSLQKRRAAQRRPSPRELQWYQARRPDTSSGQNLMRAPPMTTSKSARGAVPLSGPQPTPPKVSQPVVSAENRL